MATKKQDSAKEQVVISAPNEQTATFLIEGTAPYVQNRFGAKALGTMHDAQAAGPQAKKGKKREPKDFQALYEDAKHVSTDGWCGLPAPAFRIGMVDACRLCGFKMTLAKMGVFIEADGFDRVDSTPLVKITKGEPEYSEMATRNATGVCDLRARPLWQPGWQAELRIRFDADMFTLKDVANLLMRVGQQVGIGEGRPFSKNSCGMGWGLFRIVEK